MGSTAGGEESAVDMSSSTPDATSQLNDEVGTKESAGDDASVIEEDWGLAMDFAVFAKHQAYKVYLFDEAHPIANQSSNEQQESSELDHFLLECVESLTPLDMMNLSGGIHDATGNCVWTGAFFFLAAIEHLSQYLENKTLLELGSGTGIAGIGLLKRSKPSFICMTDGDPEATRLCERNCQLNQLDSNNTDNGQFEIATHMWGSPLEGASRVYDTVFAADILYDIGMLPAILKSVQYALLVGGQAADAEQDPREDNHHRSTTQSTIKHFILSHVPRACYNSNHPPPQGGASALEDYIVQQAEKSGLELVKIVRPLQVSNNEMIRTGLGMPKDALNDTTLTEMEEVGAAIFIFGVPLTTS